MTTPKHTKSFPQHSPLGHDDAGHHTPMEPDDDLFFEKVISNLSARFVRVASDQVDGEINAALERLLDYFKVDRCGLLGISPDGKRTYVTHAAYAEEVEQVSGDVDLAALFPWSYERLVRRGEVVNIPMTDNVHAEAETDRLSWAAMGVRSSLTIPLFMRGRVKSLIALNALRRRIDWPEMHIPRLRLLGEIFINVLERRNADQALRESEARLSRATDSAGVMPWTLDIGSGRIWTTEKAKEFFGFAPDSEMDLESFLKIVHDADREQLRRTVEETIRSGNDNSAEYRSVRPDGGIRWVLSRGRLYPAAPGLPAILMGVSIDITEHKILEGRRRESEERLAAAIEVAALGFYEMDEGLRVRFLDDRGRELIGVPLQEEQRAREFWLAHIHPDDLPLIQDGSRRVIEGGEDRFTIEYRYMHPQRGLTWIHHLSRVLERDDAGRAIKIVGVFQDISDRKRSEMERRDSMERYRAMVEAFDGLIYICSQDYRIEFMNQRLVERTGRNAVGELCYQVLHDRDSACPWCVNERILQGETVRWEVQSPKDHLWYYVANTPIQNADGTISKQSMIMDISERKQAEGELLTQKNMLQSIMSVMNSGITIRDLNYDLTYQNEYSVRMFGNHLGEKCYRVFEGIDVICDNCPVAKAIEDGMSHSLVKEIEMIPGEISFWENTAVPMRDANGNIYACLEVNHNITERKLAEEALRQSEAALRSSQNDFRKLAGRLISAKEVELRRLSRELHDDLTQRLAVIAIEAGKLELDLNKMPAAHPVALQKISKVKEQLIKVSEDVHRISRQLHPTILDDLGLVRAIESECTTTMRRENLEIIFRHEGVPAAISSDIELCIYRVVQEGLKNVITHASAKSCEILLKSTDNSLCLTVSDDGRGFDPAEVRHKPGLGLSSMRERAQLVRGDFSINSQPGQGAAIRICVPLNAGDA